MSNEDLWEYVLEKLDSLKGNKYEVNLKKFVVEYEYLLEKDPDKFKTLFDTKYDKIIKETVEEEKQKELEVKKKEDDLFQDSLKLKVDEISIVDENPSRVKDNAFDFINASDLDNASKRKLKNFVTGKMNLSRKDPVKFEELFKKKYSEILFNLNKSPLRWERRDDGSLFVSVKSDRIDYATYNHKIFTIAFVDGNVKQYGRVPRKVFERFVYIDDEERRYHYFSRHIHRKYISLENEYF